MPAHRDFPPRLMSAPGKRKGAKAIIHDGIREIDPSEDRAEVLADFERARNAMHVARSRAKARKKPKV